MIDNFFKYTASLILILMFFLLLFSSWNEAGTMDELAHIPSGYSYLVQKDYRLNPEHPPLIKDLSALPLVFLNLNFPTDVDAWAKDVNGQWEMGRIFIYESGNDADKIFRYSRLPVILLAILFGFMFFRWVRNLYGNKVALLALFLFAFSPTFLAHSRYVTTDLAAAFGFFIGIAYFLNFLFKQNRKNLIIAGIVFGIAQLLKFSLMLLAPLYVIFGALWVYLNHYSNFSWKNFLKSEFKMLGKIILIGLIGFAVILPVYIFHTWNYPTDEQVTAVYHNLEAFRVRFMVDFTALLSGNGITQAIGQYTHGLFMVLQRAAGGNTTYFVGQISAGGWYYYFPLLYLLKEHLAFHILTVLAIIFGIKNIVKNKRKNRYAILEWMRENFVLTASFIFIGVYWLQAITSPLNIGVRHVLPTFPFIYLLVSRQTIRWVKGWKVEKIYLAYIEPAKRALLLSFLLFWMILATVVNFPYFLSYYNELGGSTTHGYKFATDSNYDWGQDLKRLVKIVEENNISKIAVDYFGGGNPKYYLGDKFEAWWSAKGRPQPEAGEPEWFAISLTFLMGGHARSVDGFFQPYENTYPWLRDEKPVARAGTSIFIYKF